MDILIDKKPRSVDVSQIKVLAAAYLRKSTNQQQYSIAHQLTALLEYASAHQIEIVRLYEDAGRSGLTMRYRPAFRQLLADVESGAATYSVILVYDLSRWGRFQDIDESAHFEYRCRKKGISVEYCAEAFGSESNLLVAIMKGVKRAMAGEFSREISAKAFKGHCHLAALGFSQGGSPGFGLQRMLVDRDRNPRTLMIKGQRKGFNEDRVIIVPGAPEEIAIVRMIFRLYADEGYSGIKIAQMLNSKSFQCNRRRPWNPVAVYDMLHNERYAGTLVYNRTSKRLSSPQIDNSQQQWIRCPRAIEPIVDEALFARAQKKLKRRVIYSDTDILNCMTAVWCIKGYLTGTMLSRNPHCPDRRTVNIRFGRMKPALKAVGYVETRAYKHHNLEEKLTRLDRGLIAQLTSLVLPGGRVIQFEGETGKLRLPDGRWMITIVVPFGGCSGRERSWWLQIESLPKASDFVLVARLRKSNSGILDLHVLPFGIFTASLVQLSAQMMDVYSSSRLMGLSDIAGVIERCFPKAEALNAPKPA